MRTGTNREIYLDSLGNSQAVMIPVNFAHSKRDIIRYLRSHFSKDEVKILSNELLGKKILIPSLVKSPKIVRKVIRFSENKKGAKKFDYIEFFGERDKKKNIAKDLDITFDIEMNLDHSQLTGMLITYNNPEKLERGGSVTYKKLLKEKHISNRCNFGITKTGSKILKLFEAEKYIISIEIYNSLLSVSIEALRKNLNRLITMGILERKRHGKYFSYKRVCW